MGDGIGEDLASRGGMESNGSAMSSWGFYALFFRLSTDLCFMYVVLFINFAPIVYRHCCG